MRILFTLMLLLTFSCAFAQPSKKVNTIRKTVEQINKGKNYTTKRLEGEQFLEQMTDNGGELIGYFKNGHLVKIDEIVGLSSCENHTTYYLKNDKLIFAYTRGTEDTYIDSIGTFSSSNYILKMECKFYFENGKMIKSVLKGATRCSGAPDNDWAKEYQKEFLRYRKLLQNK